MTKRQPKGTENGGQFAADTHAESTVSLVEIDLDSSGAKVTISADGERHWTLNGVLNREDGPAVESRDGTNEWWGHGRLFMIEHPDGSKTHFGGVPQSEVEENEEAFQ